jgi:hypothetical protein
VPKLGKKTGFWQAIMSGGGVLLKTFKGARLHSLQKRNTILKESGFDPLDPDMPITVKTPVLSISK